MNAEADDVLIHPTAVVDTGAVIGEHSRVWHFSHISSNARIGKGCVLGQNVFVAGGVRIGNNVKVQNNVSIYDGVELEDDVFCGPSMVFTNVKNPRSAYPRRDRVFDKTRVRKGATIGANATIVCGVIIGRWSFIGAGAVVTCDVPDYAMMAGVPAKRIGWASQAGERLEFAGGKAVCPRTNHVYVQASSELVERIDEVT